MEERVCRALERALEALGPTPPPWRREASGCYELLERVLMALSRELCGR